MQKDDVIYRQAAIDALRNAENHAFNAFYDGLVKAHKIIAELPSAEPEIIRCKNCKHFAGEGMYCACNIIVPIDNFYCYFGGSDNG